MTPRTIITYLTDWNPSWIKTVEFSNRLIKWISIPRKDFKNAIKRDELNYSWIYFLLWEDEEWNDLAYIWQATVLKNRITNHYNNTEKDFWNTAVCFTYKDWSLTESDINFLERELISNAKNVDRYIIKNNTVWNNWLIQEHRIPDMHEFIEDLKILFVNLWYSVLKEVVSKKEIENEDNIYFLTARWSNAKWVYTDEWFLVLKWSRWPKLLVASTIERKRYAFRHRPILLEKWVIKEEWDEIIFVKDFLFKAPSWASDVTVWRDTNWWIIWKDKNWKTLDENERQNLED